MTTARLTLLSSCQMSLNVFLMIFCSWCGDVTWLSLGDSIFIWFCLPWKITRQSTAPARHRFWRWHPLDSSAVTPKHPLGAVQSSFWSDSSSLGGGLLTTQGRIDFSKELVEITGSKGRSQGRYSSFYSPFSLSLIFIQVTGTCLTYFREHITEQSSNIFIMKTKWGNLS